MTPENIDLWLFGIGAILLTIFVSAIIYSNWWTIIEWIDRCNDRKKQKDRRKFALRRR